MMKLEEQKADVRKKDMAFQSLKSEVEALTLDTEQGER